MNESDSDGDRGRSSPAPRRPPRPVRPSGVPREGSDDEGGGGGGRRESKKPTPVREMPAVEAPPPSPAEPDLEEAEVSIDDDSWVVKVLGRSGGKRASATPLLLLGFWPEEAEGEHRLEALVVGRTLAELTPAALRGAHREAQPPPEPPERRQDTGGRSGGSRRPRRSRDGR